MHSNNKAEHKTILSLLKVLSSIQKEAEYYQTATKYMELTIPCCNIYLHKHQTATFKQSLISHYNLILFLENIL